MLQCFWIILTLFAGKIRVLKQKSIGAKIQGQKGENCENRALDLCARLRGRRMSIFYTEQLQQFVHARTLCAPAQGPAHELGFLKIRRKSAPQVSLT